MSVFKRAINWWRERRRDRMLADFETTFYGKNIARFKDKHKGERCFIIGNGPSLTAADLTALHEKGEVTFGMNRIYNIFPQTQWRPVYYCCEDETIIRDTQKEINAIETKDKFIPIDLKWYHGVDITDAHWFCLNYNEEKGGKYNFSPNAAKQINCYGTVTLSCVQLAAYMGFKEIYLIGVDHNFAKIIDADGNVIENKDVKDYFCENYDTDIKEEVTHNLGQTTLSYMKARKYCDENGIKVFNATRGGKLEVYERVDLDKILNSPKGINV